MQREKGTCCNEYKIVFMDINMPVMSGIRASNIIKTKIKLGELKTIPIIGLSAETMNEEEIENLFNQSGFVEYLMKPISKEKFMDSLVRHNALF